MAFLFELGGLILLEGIVIFLVPVFVRSIVRHFSLSLSDEGIAQFDVFRFRRVNMRWLDITVLEDVGGALWVKSPSDTIPLGSGLDWKDPTGLIEYVEEHVRPEVRCVSRK